MLYVILHFTQAAKVTPSLFPFILASILLNSSISERLLWEMGWMRSMQNCKTMWCSIPEALILLGKLYAELRVIFSIKDPLSCCKISHFQGCNIKRASGCISFGYIRKQGIFKRRSQQHNDYLYFLETSKPLLWSDTTDKKQSIRDSLVVLLHPQGESEDPWIHLNFKSIFALCKKTVSCLTMICSTVCALIGYTSHLLGVCERIAVITVLST